MHCLRRKGLLLFAAAVAVSAPAVAKDKPAPAESPLMSAAERCRQIPDQAKRLACFDNAVSALEQATRSGEVSVVDRAEVRKTRHSLFGFSLPKIPFFSGDTTMNEAQDKLESTITSVKALYNGYFEIVLADNNATWRTTESNVSFDPPKPGQKITILRGLLGNYFLQINGQVGVRGKRVA
jgi:hypothetical protein